MIKLVNIGVDISGSMVPDFAELSRLTDVWFHCKGTFDMLDLCKLYNSMYFIIPSNWKHFYSRLRMFK